VPELSAKISVTVKVQLKKEREIKTTERNSTEKLVTEDVLQETQTSSNAESMVDQTTMTTLPKLMSDVQVLHTSIRLERLEQNSESLVTALVGFTEKERMENGDH